ncbi:adenylyl-sulfate kinase [Chelatococcus sp. XZ-Ab1]|uniref:adenylyl-sulfate kinase n=1 Tax=Chelatococcus sp. XZ-Ab1 TaxID=3034027 RepID=UPI0023E3B2B6|nr:adenylyl-sulfate kinase [Chelatococcus sp. XZ-Ab1]
MRIIDACATSAAPIEEHGLLRVLACGAVDDGKSTLLGRLMADAGLVPEDQMAAVAGAGGEDGFDYALLLDGLAAEREQGITIDVAYRYFATARRSFIVVDAPGHEQFTRNMATGASICDAAVLLVDARKGLLPQTRRHAVIAGLMGIRDVILAVNKMDLVGHDENVFRAIVASFRSHADSLGLDVRSVPLSAALGENIVHPAAAMPWHAGPTLLDLLETLALAPRRTGSLRFPVQRVSRSDPDFRGYQGTVAGGRVRRGDPVVALPGGQPSRIRQIVTFAGELEEAGPGEAVTLVLDREIEAGRGTVFACPDNPPACVNHVVVRLVWLSEMPLGTGRELLMRQGTDLVPCRITALRSRLDVVRMAENPATTLGANDIGTAVLETGRPVVVERYGDNRTLGSLLLIDRLNNETLAAGMVVEAVNAAANVYWQRFDTTTADRPSAGRQTPAILWLTGPSGAGKSTVANALERRLTAAGCHAYVLDGDNMRHGLNRDLGFSPPERAENVRRLAEVAHILADAGLIAIVAAIAPYAQDRANARAIAKDVPFYEIFVDTPLDVCASRDPKGLYMRARQGLVSDFTGVGAPYERPQAPDLRLDGTAETPQQEAGRIVDLLAARGHVPAA